MVSLWPSKNCKNVWFFKLSKIKSYNLNNFKSPEFLNSVNFEWPKYEVWEILGPRSAKIFNLTTSERLKFLILVNFEWPKLKVWEISTPPNAKIFDFARLQKTKKLQFWTISGSQNFQVFPKIELQNCSNSSHFRFDTHLSTCFKFSGLLFSWLLKHQVFFLTTAWSLSKLLRPFRFFTHSS